MDNNCFVFRLKSSINNPNLPVVETMQQFTLDAIEASENESMTDAQKVALNHFFYQIGAIDNTGIFSKLELLNLAFICGTKTGALTDFAKDNTPLNIAQGATFSNGGFVAETEGGNISEYNISQISENYFYCIVGENESHVRMSAVYPQSGTLSNRVTVDIQRNNNKVMLTVDPNVTYIAWAYADITSVPTLKGASININGSNVTAFAIDANGVSELTNCTIHEEEGNNRTVNKILIKGETTNNSPYACAVGSGLTVEEQQLFMTELKTLMDAFAQSNENNE